MAFTKTTLQYATQLTVTEILAGNVVGLSDKLVKHTTLNKSELLDSTTTPPVTLVVSNAQAGSGTIDLTSMVGTNDTAVDGSGLKVQAAKFANPSTNANAITVKFGASDAYLLGGAAWTFILEPGMEIVAYGNDATPDIAAGAKDIDVAATGVQPLNYTIVMG